VNLVAIRQEILNHGFDPTLFPATRLNQYWKQRFEGEISEFIGDQKFPSTDMPTQAQSMWEQDASLSANGWSLYAGW
jgi:hypothetical protein